MDELWEKVREAMLYSDGDLEAIKRYYAAMPRSQQTAFLFGATLALEAEKSLACQRAEH